MSCFRIDLSAYNGIDEAKLDAWAKRFFKTYIWKKPVLFGEVVESDYKRQQLQTLVNHNLKNWKAEKTLRYNKQWVTRITPWRFAAEFPAGNQAFAAHKIERLAAILSLQNVGFSSWKQETQPRLAKKVCEEARVKWSNFSFGEMDSHKAQYGDGNPEGWKLLRMREEKLKDDFGKALERVHVCEEVLAKRQRVV